MKKRIFQYTDSKSNKFWAINLKGKSIVVNFGKIGTEGQVNIKSFSSEKDAKEYYDKLINEKLKKGYFEQNVPKAQKVNKKREQVAIKKSAVNSSKSKASSPTKLIGRLDDWLKKNRPEYYNQLSKGVTEKQLNTFEKYLGFNLPRSFKELYLWKNGQVKGNYQSFQYNFMFDQLAGMKETWRVMNELLPDFKRKNWWSRYWIPFMANGGGDHICLDLEGTFTGQKGQIIEFWHDWECREILHESFDKWLETFVISLEEGLWEEVSGCYEPVKGKRYCELYKKINQNYPIKKKAG